jgi:hypothetical protein
MRIVVCQLKYAFLLTSIIFCDKQGLYINCISGRAETSLGGVGMGALKREKCNVIKDFVRHEKY